MRYITEDYRNKIESIIENGGTLWVVERTDTHQFAFETNLYNPVHQPQIRLEWTDTLDMGRFMGEYYLYLSKEDFDKENLTLRDGACEHCRGGGTEIPIVCIEHEFVNSDKAKKAWAKK